MTQRRVENTRVHFLTFSPVNVLYFSIERKMIFLEFGDDSEKSTPTSSEVNLGGESAKVLIPTRSTSSGELRWFHKLSWVLYSFAIDVGMAVTIAFWVW